MVDIRPFKAVRYTQKAGNLKSLITQPYDKINQDMQREYYEKSPYNYCRLILPIEENRYQTVHQRIYEWLNEHVLAKDDAPALFVCRQEFRLGGNNCSRTGLIAALRLCAYSEGMVFPHETTYSAPKADRLNMLRTIQKDLEPVFLIYSDPEKVTVDFFKEVATSPPDLQVEDELRVCHKVWKVSDPEDIALVQKALERKHLVITDGHHRYESALAYRDERRGQVDWTEDSAFNFHMSYIVPVQDEGLVILPTHRLLRRFELTIETIEALASFFEISEIDPTVDVIESFLREHKAEHAFCIYDGIKAYGLLLRDEHQARKVLSPNSSGAVRLLDVVILKDIVFKTMMKTGELKIEEDIVYERSTKSAMERVDNEEVKLAFLVNSISPKVVWEVAQKRERLPEKSTDFYPKPASGLMMMDISATEKL
ncbi:MAG: DUF1015 domain-containing protein [Candidatus Bathyarchaeota archaeon]|nr:DUF1015 domain-containing protein [Candidatus Bathyarchaeota archaeon]